MNDEHLSQLTSMGFPLSQASEALSISGGNLEHAVNYLLSGGGAGVGAGASSSSSAGAVVAGSMDAKPAAMPKDSKDSIVSKAADVLRANISQYSVPDGRSACTCIALTSATAFLNNQVVTPEFLESMILKGVENYKTLVSSTSGGGGNNSIEHLSCEEVLQNPNGKALFPVKTSGPPRQGVLSNDLFHPMGLKALLEGIQQEQPPTEWTVVLMTKTPETVLLCFPPPTLRPSSYWLIDSHPRPQLGVDTAYAKIHPNLDSLWMSLQAIFPCTELGPDIPEMMAMMYNSFDLYPLTK